MKSVNRASMALIFAGPTRPPLPDKKFPPQESEFTLSGRWDVSDVEGPAFKEFLKKHGLSDK